MGRPALFGGPAPQPLIFLQPPVDLWERSVTDRRFADLALIPTGRGRWFFCQEFGHGIA